jgi:hypothetical protein
MSAPATDRPIVTDPAVFLGELAADHPTPDDLAAHLHRAGATGIPCEPMSCVVADYLRTFYPDADIVVNPVSVSFGNSEPGWALIDGRHVILPGVINALADGFDEYKYPDLITPGYQDPIDSNEE